MHTTVKLVIVAVISALIAYLVGITDYILVGTIGILSVSLTKKDTVKDNINRYIDVLLGIFLAAAMFYIFGFNLYALVAYLIVFIFISYALKINIGLIPALVLAKHLYDAQDISWVFMLERFGIITISIATALVISFIYPEFYNKRMNHYVKTVDGLLKEHLSNIADYLNNQANATLYTKQYHILNEKINDVIIAAEVGDKDKLFDLDRYYLAYLYMRRNQLNYMNNMFECIMRIEKNHPYERIISAYIKALVLDIGLDDKATTQLIKLAKMKTHFKEEALPKTRTEFETRALLFHILEDLEQMLQVKVTFHERYPNFTLV